MIAGGVFAGAATPLQDTTSKPGNPCSAMVGTSGMSGERFSVALGTGLGVSSGFAQASHRAFVTLGYGSPRVEQPQAPPAQPLLVQQHPSGVGVRAEAELEDRQFRVLRIDVELAAAAAG